MKRKSCSSFALFIILSSVVTLFANTPYFAMSIKEEKELSKEFLKYVHDRFEVIKDPVINQYINQLGNKILEQAPPQPFEYHFYIIKEEIYNAFASPAGHIFINSGLFSDLASEEELAGILSHEIAHVVCRHISKRISAAKKAELASLAGAIAGAFLHASGSAKEGQALAMTSIASGQSFILAYTRENEIQADQISLEYLNKAGYSGKGLIKALERISSQQLFGSDQIPTYLKTHPASEERMAGIDTWIHGKEPIRESIPDAKDDFRMAQIRFTALYTDEIKAEQKLTEIAAKKDPSGMNFYGLGMFFSRKGSYDKAEMYFRKAIEKNALNPSFLEELGKTYFNAGNYQKAIGSLKTVLDISPKSPVALYYFGRALLSTGDFKGAIEKLDRFVSISPTHEMAHYFLGEAYSKTEDPFHSHYHLGIHYFNNKDFENSLFHLKKAQAYPDLHSKEKIIREMIRDCNEFIKKGKKKKR